MPVLTVCSTAVFRYCLMHSRSCSRSRRNVAASVATHEDVTAFGLNCVFGNVVAEAAHGRFAQLRVTSLLALQDQIRLPDS